MDLVAQSSSLLREGLINTIFLALTSFLIACVLGLLTALARMSHQFILQSIAILYVSVIRGTPLLVQLLLVYFGLPQIGIILSPIPSAIVALSINAGAYLSEQFRGGILSVEKGQREAALSMGMSYWQTMRRIVLPQAIRIALPAVTGQFIALIKDTSLASVITVVEITAVAEQVGASTFRYMQMFVIAAVLYWVVSTALTLGQGVLAYRLAKAY